MPRKIIFIAALLVTLAACESGQPPELDQPIVFIGVDSADWTWIDPLLESGKMPNIAALSDRGVRASLESLVPLQKSPTIWTSIATGKRPAKHGIADFITTEHKVQTSNLRKSATYWEILGELGRTQAVLGWWITHPATPVNGVLVSDFLPYFEFAKRQDASAVYPPESWDLVAANIVRPKDITDEQLARFVDLDILAEYPEHEAALIKDLRDFVAGDLTYLSVARALYAAQPYDVFTVYFRGLDMTCHSYWQWFEPKYSGHSREDWRVQALGGIIPAYYEFVDELVGEVLGFVDTESRVMVASDHGFLGHRRRVGSTTVGVKMHREQGILLMAGPGIKHGEQLERAEVKDLMPTLLAMSGVPLARDLDGHLLGSAFEPKISKWFDTLLTHSVDSYEAIVSRPEATGEIDPEANAAMLEQLRSLGYIE